MGPIAPVISVIAGIYGIYSGMKQEDQAKKAAAQQEELARKNAANIEAEAMEEKRRTQEVADREQAKNRAKAAASGVAGGGSMDIFMGAEEDRWQRQMDWTLKSGQSRAGIARQGGYMDASATRAQGEQAKWSMIGSGAKSAIGGGQDLSTWYKGYSSGAHGFWG